MLYHPTIDKLHELRLSGMAKALEEQNESSGYDGLTFEERLGFLLDREKTDRDNKRLLTRLRKAKLRQTGTIEDIDFRHPRGLDRQLILTLSNCNWIRSHQNCIITGPTGIGKSYLACALAHKACREGYRAQYVRFPRLVEDLSIAKADGRYRKILTSIFKMDLLVVDDWGLSIMTEEQRRDFLEIIEDRDDLRSTLIASQIPLKKWHTVIGDPTLGDAILDRLVHHSYKIALKGDSLRKNRKKLCTE